MFTIFFGELACGRLSRPDYIRYSVLLFIIGGNTVVAVQGLLIGLGVRGGISQLETVAHGRFGPMGSGAVWATALVFLAACLNLLSKRARDAGLSGGLLVLMLMLAGRLFVGIDFAEGSAAVLVAVWLALMTVPSGRFDPRQGTG